MEIIKIIFMIDFLCLVTAVVYGLWFMFTKTIKMVIRKTKAKAENTASTEDNTSEQGA